MRIDEHHYRKKKGYNSNPDYLSLLVLTLIFLCQSCHPLLVVQTVEKEIFFFVLCTQLLNKHSAAVLQQAFVSKNFQVFAKMTC